MKPDATARRTRKGYLILAVLLAAGALVFNSDRIADTFRDHLDIVALVDRTQGVRVGSPVHVEGMEVGRVTDLAFTTVGGRGAVAVQVRLESRAGRLVRQSSLAHTARKRFVGEPLVRITAGPVDAPPVQDGDTLMPAGLPTPDALLTRSRALPGALDSLTRAMRRVQGLAGDRRHAIADLGRRVSAVTSEADLLRRRLEQGSAERWLEDPTLARRIERVRIHADSLAEIARGLGRYTGEGELRASTQALGARGERLSAALDDLENSLAGGAGMLARAPRDSALAVAIGRVRAQIDSIRAEGLDFALRTLVP